MLQRLPHDFSRGAAASSPLFLQAGRRGRGTNKDHGSPGQGSGGPAFQTVLRDRPGQGLCLTPGRQEVPAKTLSFYPPHPTGTKTQREPQQTKGELEPLTKGGALRLMDSLIFEFPEVSS